MSTCFVLADSLPVVSLATLRAAFRNMPQALAVVRVAKQDEPINLLAAATEAAAVAAAAAQAAAKVTLDRRFQRGLSNRLHRRSEDPSFAVHATQTSYANVSGMLAKRQTDDGDESARLPGVPGMSVPLSGQLHMLPVHNCHFLL